MPDVHLGIGATVGSVIPTVNAIIPAAVPVGLRRHKHISARDSGCKSMASGIDVISGKHTGILKMFKKPQETWVTQMETLGRGNHCIELCIDDNKDVWVILHSGSRGLGNAIGRYFIALAKKDMQGHMHNTPNKVLCYFSEGNHHLVDYVEASASCYQRTFTGFYHNQRSD